MDHRPLAAAAARHHGLLRVTTIERTLVDLGAMLSPAALRSLIESQLVRRSTTFSRVEATHLRLAGKGRHGVAVVRRVLAEIDGMPPTESVLEAAFVRLLQEHRLPVPDTQVRFEWSSGERGRVDCCYRDAAMIVELDGRRFHERSAAFERDRRRDQHAATLGFRTLRFTHRQVMDEARHVAQVVRSVLDGASRR